MYHSRVTVTGSSTYPDEFTVRVHGTTADETYTVVDSIDGLRCLTEGTIEGVPCDPDDYILPGDWSFASGDNFDMQLDGTQTIVTQTSSEQLYVVGQDHSSQLAPTGVRVTDVTGTNDSIAVPIGRLGHDLVRKVIEADAHNIGDTFMGCAGLPNDLSVPLESEITENNDPYENSWQHYLDLAGQMADEADRLGEELIRAGLDLDVRGEAARDELENLCGGVVNVDDIFGNAPAGGGLPEELPDLVSESSLSTCLPGEPGTETVPWSTLGSTKVCAWQEVGLGAPCVCSPSTTTHLCGAPGERNPNCFCTAACPIAAPAEGCDDAFGTLPDNDGTPEDPEDPEYHFAIIPDSGSGETVRTLNLIPSSEADAIGVDCTALGDLRTNDVDVDRSRLIRSLQLSWLKYGTLHQLMSVARLDEDFRDDSVLTFGGLPAISTKDIQLPPCATGYPQEEALTRAAAKLFGPIAEAACPGENNLAETRQYIRHLRRAFATLGLLSGGLDGNLLRSVAYPAFHDGEDCQELVASSEVDVCPAYDWWPGALPCSSECACLRGPAQTGDAYGDIACADGVRMDYAVTVPLGDDLSGVMNVLWGYPASVDSLYNFLANRPVDAHLTVDWDSAYVFSHSDGIPSLFSEPAEDILDPSGLTQWQDMASLTTSDVYDALALACYALSSGGGCSRYDPTVPPPVPVVSSADDLRKVENYLDCAADTVRTTASRTILARIPAVVADYVGSGHVHALYPGYQGENLQALTAVQTDIQNLAALATAIQDQLRRGALSTSLTRQRLARAGVEGEIAQLQSVAELLATMRNAAAGAFTSFGASTMDLLSQVVINREIASLQAGLVETQEDLILTDYVGEIGDILTAMTDLGTEVRTAILALNRDVARVQSIQSAALSAAARAAFADQYVVSERVFPVTTVMRRRYNTLRLRYERARDRARQLGFIARRAIEQRFGVDLGAMDRDLSLVEAPSRWANDVCIFEGVNYDRIRHEQYPNPDGTPIEDLVPENYVEGYLGEYVEKLRLFVESYPFDYPFQDGSDLAVISLRDDIFKTRVACETTVPNLFASSDSMEAGGDVWLVAGCPDEDEDGFPDVCLEVADEPEALLEGTMATRVADADIEDVSLTGVVYQDVVVEEGDRVLLSWRDGYLGGGSPEDYHVSVEHLETNAIAEADFEPPTIVGETPPGERRLSLVIGEPGTVRVTIDPSADSAAGEVWLSELQLEVLTGERLWAEDPEPSDYQPTTSSGMAVLEVCADLNGDTFRERYFELKDTNICPAGMGRDCHDDGGAIVDHVYYREATFNLDLEQIERGGLIPSGAFALGNYNYRNDLVAVNLVGTNVRDCSESGEPATCYANAFIPFSLEQRGTLPVRNHDGETISFPFGTGLIEHGKALADEAVVTNPVTRAMDDLLGSYYKSELRGRPLTGQYWLRIWDGAPLNWNNVEDVQLVFRYRYWTRLQR